MQFGRISEFFKRSLADLKTKNKHFITAILFFDFKNISGKKSAIFFYFSKSLFFGKKQLNQMQVKTISLKNKVEYHFSS